MIAGQHTLHTTCASIRYAGRISFGISPCRRLQQFPLGALDEEVVARDLRRGQQEGDGVFSEAECRKYLSSTLYKICSRPRPENLVCGDFVQSFLEG